MNDKEENSESYDYENIIVGEEDQKVLKQKPPNDKIVHYKIIKETEDSEAK